jgi:hypothetical protein
MIYTKEDCDLLAMVIERKKLDRTVYEVIDALPPSVKSAADCQFELDISRCEAM